MKIVEVIVEADSAYEKGKAFGQRLVTPSEWFKFKKQDEPAKQDNVLPTAPSREIKGNKLRDVVNSLLRDEPRYNEDIRLLKNLYYALQSGKYTTSVDASELMKTIKTAYKGGQLSEKDKQVLSSFLTTL